MSEPETTGERHFVWPSAYYSAPTPASVLPGWSIYGCGALASLVLVMVFLGGAWLSRGGFSQFMDLAIGMSVAEMKGMYAADVPAARKESLAREIEVMRKNLTEERVALPRLRSFFELLSRAIADKKVTNSEAVELERVARVANVAAKAR
jgi:hypothetical protein